MLMSSGTDGPRWSYVASGKVVGPVGNGDLKKLIAAGVVTPATKIRLGDGQWLTAGRLAALVPLFQAAQRSDPEKPQSPAAVGQSPATPRPQAPSATVPATGPAPPSESSAEGSGSALADSTFVMRRDDPEPEPRSDPEFRAPLADRRGERQRRAFSKLVVAARMLDGFAIICGIGATLNAGGALMMMVVGEPTNAVMGVREAWVVVVVGLAFAVLLRAAAEFIRLAIYAVELLEDIRSSRA